MNLMNDNLHFFAILSEKLEQFGVISRRIAKTTEIGRGWDFTIYNWSEQWFHETLKMALEDCHNLVLFEISICPTSILCDCMSGGD